MPFTQQDNLLTLDAGLGHFKAVYMPARNCSNRTREEYESDLTDLISFLAVRVIASWRVVGLRDLQSYLADLDRRGLAPASRNRKTYALLHGVAHALVLQDERFLPDDRPCFRMVGVGRAVQSSVRAGQRTPPCSIGTLLHAHLHALAKYCPPEDSDE